MSAILVDHPDEWIGIPENWAGTRWETGYEWASELVDALREDFGPPVENERATLRDVLVTVSNSLDKQTASRLYISVDGWAGPLYIATMAMLSRDSLPGLTTEQVAGSDDPDVVEKPIVSEFVTVDGLTGVKCVRYANDREAGGILAKVDYVVPVPGSFIRFSTALYDLVDFEAVQPRLERLAKSVTVAD